MTLSGILTQPVPQEYPNALALPTPDRRVCFAKPALWVGLVLLCLIPRAWMAFQVEGICPDATLYIRLAKSIDAGNFAAGLHERQLSTFPIILAAVHRLGLDWVTAGEAWGVFIASLVVLPMYGWVRRQFDDRVALVACLMYAVHPKLITWSPEVIRDPTFWFLFMLTLYLLWRAITEVRIRLFLAAGLAMILSWLTRFEGLFLLIPLALWTFWRFRALAIERRRLVVGALLSVVALPLLAALFNLMFLNRVALSRLQPLALVQAWMTSFTGASVPCTAGIVCEVGAPAGLPFREMLHEFFPTMTRGLAPAFALLMFGGMWGWRNLWMRRDHQTLFYTSLALSAGIWINLWYVQVSCPRYAFSIVLMGSPFAALGFLGATSRCVRLVDRWTARESFRRAAAFVPMANVVLLSAIGVAATDYSSREAEVNLGKVLRGVCGSGARLVGPTGLTTSVTFYVEGTCETFPHEPADETVLSMVDRVRPDAILFQRMRRTPPNRYLHLIERMREYGLEPLDRSLLPAGADKCYVLVRRPEPRLANSYTTASGENRH